MAIVVARLDGTQRIFWVDHALYAALGYPGSTVMLVAHESGERVLADYVKSTSTAHYYREVSNSHADN